MVMRGRPAIGSMMRISCGGRNVRPNCSKRGAKSVMRTAPPLRSVSTVVTIAVLRTYSDCDDDEPVEHDVGEALLLVAREQPAEHRIAVEAREAPPHDARQRIDQRGGAAIADDGEIEVLLRGGDIDLAWCDVHRFSCGGPHHLGDPAPHVARRLEHAGDPLHLAPDREADAVEFGQHLERGLVGHVVADEDRPAALERRVLHQITHRGALVERWLLHLDHRLARQDFESRPRRTARRSRSPRRAPRGRDAAPAGSAARSNSPCPRR